MVDQVDSEKYVERINFAREERRIRMGLPKEQQEEAQEGGISTISTMDLTEKLEEQQEEAVEGGIPTISMIYLTNKLEKALADEKYLMIWDKNGSAANYF